MIEAGYCICAARGWCAKHRRKKTQREFDICQAREGIDEGIVEHYRQGWDSESGISPQSEQKAIKARMQGAGDLAENVIKVVTLGLAKPCSGCNRRKAKWNRILPFRSTIPDTPIDKELAVKHIIYHILPLGGEAAPIWKKHVAWLREVRPFFNGRLLISINEKSPEDPWEFSPMDEVLKELEGLGAEVFIFSNGKKRQKGNNVSLGEGIGFLSLLEKLQSGNLNEVVFYGHSKGVTRTTFKAPHEWAAVMFDSVFRHPDLVLNSLDSKGITGSLRMNGNLPDGPGIGPFWFYSGTFFAFRSAAVFSRRWNRLPKHYGCVEQWPRILFDLHESGVLFFDGVQNLYDEQYWQHIVRPSYREWETAHAQFRIR